MKEIHLTQGKVAIVDDTDFEALNAHKWYAHREARTVYALRNVRRPDGGRTSELMHRVVLSRKLDRALLRGEQGEHRNGDGISNWRDNLRLATDAQNGRNRHRRVANPSSQYLGVSRDKRHKNWQVHIRVNGKKIYLGRYATEFEAALAREYYITAHPELMARPNFDARTAREGGR